MNPIIITPDSHEHWLALRAEDVTSTEASALFRMNPRLTEFELWHAKAGGAVREFVSTERIKWGNRLEDAIAAGYAEEYGVEVRPLKDYMRHGSGLRMGSSFDYEIPSTGELLEIKNVDSLQFKEKWLDGEPPPHITIQAQLQMEVANRDRNIVCAFVGGNELIPFPQERRPRVGKALVQAITKFWESVDAGTPPEPDFEKDAEFINAMYQDGSGEVIDVRGDEIITALAVKYKEAAAVAKEADGRKKAAKAEILTHIGDAAKAFGEGFTISAGNVVPNPGTLITAEMVGEFYGARKGRRHWAVNFKKEK